MTKFQPSIGDAVFIFPVKKKGIVKEVNLEKNTARVTYYDPKTDKRRTLEFEFKKLSPFKDPKNFKYNAGKLIEGQKEFSNELKKYLDSSVKSGQQEIVLNKKETEMLEQALRMAKKIASDTQRLGKGIGDSLKSIHSSINSVSEKQKNPLKIKVKYFTNVEPLTKISKGDWIDLRSAITIEMKAGEYKMIPLGVGMKLPEGYEANVVPRSSTFKNFGIIQTNHYGVIDNSYSGNEDQWHFPAYALRDTVINKNDRICQFRINEIMPEVEIVEVDSLDENSRGGFGSSGVN